MRFFSRRRLLIVGLHLVSLAVVALVAWYIGRNLTGIGPVPTRSAFAGRLPGTPDGAMRRFQFFYATNRDTRDQATFLGEGIQGNRLGTTIATGTFDVRISPYMSIQPWVWLDPKQMQWADRQDLAQDEALTQLRAAVQASPQKSLLVIVWGYRDWFRSAALKTAYTAYVLDINTPVLLFDWPGNQGDNAAGYRAAMEVSAQSAPDLGRVLARALRETGAVPLTSVRGGARRRACAAPPASLVHRREDRSALGLQQHHDEPGRRRVAGVASHHVNVGRTLVERLPCLERDGRLAFHLHDDLAFEHVDERMGVVPVDHVACARRIRHLEHEGLLARVVREVGREQGLHVGGAGRDSGEHQKCHKGRAKADMGDLHVDPFRPLTVNGG